VNKVMGYAVGDPVKEACRLCAGQDQRVKLVIERPDRFERAAGIAEAGYERYWLECDACGLLNDCYGHDISSIYSDQYYDPAVEGETVRERFKRVLALPNAGSDNWARVQRIKDFVQRQRPAGCAGTPTALSAMDIGSGTGIFLYRLMEAMPGWQATAVEPSPQACEHLRTLGQISAAASACCDLEVIEGYYTAQVAHRQRYDLVTLNKVVEHLPDPVQLVRDAGEALKPNGILYVEVPDKATAEHRPATDNILGALHYCLFDAATLAMTFTRAGLSPVQIQRYVEPSGKITVSGFAVRRNDFANEYAAP